MTFSFDPALSTSVSRVRFHLGDTVAAGAFFADETYEAVLVLQTDERLAAAQLALALAARFTGKSGSSKRIGSTSVSYGEMADAFRALAKQLQSGDDGTGVPTLHMLVGGISQADRRTLLDNTGDRISPSFALRQMDSDSSAGDDGDDHGVDR